jgi:hypothetical protein
MPLRLCSILGTLLLALAVATPVFAQATETAEADEGDGAAETRAKKRKARAKKRAEAAAEAKADTNNAQAKRNKKKKAKAEEAEEESKAEGDEDTALSASEASTQEAVPEPDSWERPPMEEEKPPAPPAPKAVEPPAHAGLPLSAGLLVGWGFETDRRNTSFSADPYGLGAGLRGGYTFDFNLYAGVYFMYYLGSAVTGSSQYVNNPTITTNANYMQFGAEFGYDWFVASVIVRPSVQLGVAMAFTNVPNIISPINDFVFAPGVTVVHPWDDYFIGGDLRANVVTGNGTSALLIAGTFGMRFAL